MTVPASPTVERGPSYEKLVAAAMGAFDERGLEAVTLDDIATAAGVHRVTLHRTFPGGRTELIGAVVHRLAVALADDLAEVVDRAPDARRALVDAVATVYDVLATSPTLAPLVASSEARASLFTPAGGPVHEAAVVVWHRIRTRAEAEGIPTLDAPDEEVVEHILRLGVSLAAEPGRITGVDAVRAYLDRYLVPALLGPPSAGRP